MKKVSEMIQNIVIDETSREPQIIFNSDGNLLIKGRSLIINVDLFFQPLIDWVRQLNASNVRCVINIDYFNSASIKKLYEILSIIDFNYSVNEFDVIWIFETHDEDILEKGKIFEEKLKRTKFQYYEYTDVL
jgi:hypothetical protein